MLTSLNELLTVRDFEIHFPGSFQRWHDVKQQGDHFCSVQLAACGFAIGTWCVSTFRVSLGGA